MITVARWVSLIAAFVWGAVAEYHLGTAVGADKITAGLLPLVLDVYGFAAMRAGKTRHIAAALAGMAGTQTVAHLLAMGDKPKHMIALSIVVSTGVPAVSLACHRLGEHTSTVGAENDSDDTAKTVETSTAVNGYSADYAIVDETHKWVSPAPATVDTVPVTAYTPVTAILDAADNGDAINTDGWTKRELAVKGAELIAQGMTKAAAAQRMGITRQWLHQCMKAESISA